MKIEQPYTPPPHMRAPKRTPEPRKRGLWRPEAAQGNILVAALYGLAFLFSLTVFLSFAAIILFLIGTHLSTWAYPFLFVWIVATAWFYEQ